MKNTYDSLVIDSLDGEDYLLLQKLLNRKSFSVKKLVFDVYVELEQLNVENWNLQELDVSKLTNLVQLKCKNNELKNLDLSNLHKLEELTYDGATEIKLPAHRLKSLGYNGPHLPEFRQFANLHSLSVFNIIENIIDISFFLHLQSFSCESSKITTLVFPADCQLKTLNCYHNQITHLDVSKLNLQQLDCSLNKITTLLVNNPQKLNCSYNQITHLQFESMSNLQEFLCNDNLINELNFTTAHALRSLFCAKNLFAKLDLSNCSELQNLTCSNNKITVLNLHPHCPLQEIYCPGNKLQQLDLSSYNNLSYLSCFANPVTNQLKIHSETTNMLAYVDTQQVPAFPKNNRLIEVN